jgi:hypothetical protein
MKTSNLFLISRQQKHEVNNRAQFHRRQFFAFTIQKPGETPL